MDKIIIIIKNQIEFNNHDNSLLQNSQTSLQIRIGQLGFSMWESEDEEWEISN